jgi:hypothetical protein
MIYSEDGALIAMLINSIAETSDTFIANSPVAQKVVQPTAKKQAHKSLILNIEGDLQELTIKLK